MTPVASISLTLPLNCSSKCTGTGLYDICWGGTLGSSRIWYGLPGNLPIPVNTEGYNVLMSCLDLITLFGFCLSYISMISFWYTTYCSVKLGLSRELVYIGIYRGIGRCSGTSITSSFRDVLHESNALPSSWVT